MGKYICLKEGIWQYIPRNAATFIEMRLGLSNQLDALQANLCLHYSCWHVASSNHDIHFEQKAKLLHFEWSPPWHHIETYLSQILTFFVLKSGEDEKERIILMKSRALRSLDFIRIILSSSSLLLVRGPAVTTVIYQAKLIQTDSRYAWFKTISDARASPDA